MDDFRRADGGQIAVALIGPDDLVGMNPLDAGGGGRGSAVHRDDRVSIKEHGVHAAAAHRGHGDGVVLDTQLINYLCHQICGDAVAAAGAVCKVH